jgi:3D (Asp-Asp-Asp) domain-containing protein
MIGLSKNNKNASLVIAAVLFYIGGVSILQKMTIRNFQPERCKSGAALAGIQMNGFTITAYCPGTCCNGVWAGFTASGKSIEYYTGRGINIAAVDPRVIALGSYFVYQETGYLAVDIGSRIKGRRIDIFKPNHTIAKNFGVKKDQSIRLFESKKKISYSKNKFSWEVL